MSNMAVQILRRRDPLRIGFLPVSDCAPLIYAHEAGLFQDYDLDVELLRQTSWASLRDKVIYGELDAAHAPATLPFLANLGLESDPCACVSGLVLSLQGNAITISRHLWEQGVRDPESLRDHIYQSWGKRTYTFGIVFSFSSQELLLRRWLKSAGIAPGADVRIVAIPPDQMFPTLKLGYIDGFCVGQPWASMAVQAGVGVCVASSSQLAPLHPEKVLMVRQSFAQGRADEHQFLIMALLRACAFCDLPQNQPLLGDMLASADYVNAPPECLQGGSGRLPAISSGGDLLEDLAVFHRHNANEPSDDKAKWLIDGLYELLQASVFKARNPGPSPVLKNVFRRDLFEGAAAALPSTQPQIVLVQTLQMMTPSL